MKSTLLFGPFRLDIAGRQLWKGDQLVPLAPKAFDLLHYLAEHQGELRTRDELFAALWPDIVVDDHALSVQIRDIRKALGDSAHNPTYIETRHRRGYCFRAAVTRAIAHAQGAAASATIEPVATETVPETRYTVNGGVNLAYQVVGDGPVDLVFVMGWVSHLEYFWTEPRFARFLRRLASFSRVILFDKRGTGLSDRVALNQLPTIEQRMEDLHAVMDAAGSDQAIICGISEGGCMSAVFAATYPERTLALVMFGPYARRLRTHDYPWGPTREQREEFLREVQEQWGGPVGLEERAPSLAHDPQFRRWWATYLRMGASPGAAVALTRMNTEIDIRSVLPAVRVPTLVIHRTDDQCLQVDEGRYVAALIPGAIFVELPGADHLPFVGDQDAILQRIEQFVHHLQEVREHDRSLATVLALDLDDAGLRDEVASYLRRSRANKLSTDGHTLLAAFEGPARAVRAASAALILAERAGIQAMAGLHTGECMSGSDNALRGSAVTVAQRIAASAGAGEVLVSGTLRDLVAGSGLEFEPRGRIEAGDLGEWQLLRLRTPEW